MTWFIGNSYVCLICHRFLYIHSRTMHDIDLDIYIGPLLSVHIMSNESQCTAFFLNAILIFPLFVTVYVKFAVKIYNKRLPLSAMSLVYSICHRLRDNYVYSYHMFSILIFDLQKVGQGHELQHCQIHCWLAYFVCPMRR